MRGLLSKLFVSEKPKENSLEFNLNSLEFNLTGAVDDTPVTILPSEGP